jgi:branched-chain amino acid transport system ATP-binding protein
LPTSASPSRRGEIRAIIGPNGAGKSTFFNCLTGVLQPTAGRILLNGEDVAGLPPNEVSHKGLARSYQITNILPGATVLENVRIAAQSRRHAWNMVRNRLSFPDILDRARAVLDAVGLLEQEDELAANLSHGAQRNLEIGIALATEPQLVCLDEPTAGMSVSETRSTVELVRRIAKDLTIVIVEHDMEVVMGLARTITVLHYGEVLARARPDPASPRVRRSTSRPDARSRRRPHLLRQVPHRTACPSRSGPGEVSGFARPERRRQTRRSRPSWASCVRRRAASPSRARDRRHGVSPRRPRHRLGAEDRRIFRL